MESADLACICTCFHCCPEYQLVTLSRDRTLRLWPISEQLSSDLGAEAGQEDEAGDFEVNSMETSFTSSQMELDMSFTPQVQLYMYIHVHVHNVSVIINRTSV